LKPSNVLLTEFGDLKLSDFGMARKIVDLIHSENESDSKKGTPYYMAPELFQEKGVYSFESDMWALGVVLYELGSGHSPFES
jgi:serine/threonine-protein kinase ULK4